MTKETFMRLPLNKQLFDVIFNTKSNCLSAVITHFGTDNQSLHDLLWEEFNVPGMEVRIANTAFDFLIDCCESKKDLRDTLKGEIRKDILMSGIYYTNIAPEAISTLGS